MSDEMVKEKHAAQNEASHEELCAQALKHYNEVSGAAHSWWNIIPQAIRFYAEHGGEQNRSIPTLAAERKAEKHERLFLKVGERINQIVKESAWTDDQGDTAIQEENFENLTICLAEYIAKLLKKAGWFVDEDDTIYKVRLKDRFEKERLFYFRISFWRTEAKEEK